MTNSAWKGSLRNVGKAEMTWASAQLKTGILYYQKEKPLNNRNSKCILLAQRCVGSQCISCWSPCWDGEVDPLAQLTPGTNTVSISEVPSPGENSFPWLGTGDAGGWTTPSPGKTAGSPLWRDDSIERQGFVLPRWLLEQSTKVTRET